MPKLTPVLYLVLFALFVTSSTIFGLLGDWFWFTSMGFDSVFITIVTTSAVLGLASFLVFFIFSTTNMALARRAALGKKKHGKGEARIMDMIAALLSLIVALSIAGSWEVFLKYNNYTPFGINDPVFGMDVGFYTFILPFYSVVLGFLLSMFSMTAILSATTYAIHSSGFSFKADEPRQNDMISQQFGASMTVTWPSSWKAFMPQISALLLMVFATISASIWFARYGILLSHGGAVFGAGYTDVMINLPVMTALSVITLVIGLLFMANIKLKKPRLILYGIGALIAISFAGFLVAGIVQGLIVEPDEFNLERAYLERNIEGTLKAYGLDSAQEDEFPVSYDLDAADIEENNGTVSNVRLWDWRPLKQTYNQLQLFRTYYDFNDVDVDRYEIDGKYKQVLVSAREMNTGELSAQAQTWVNTHLVYTHGYGVVMNPVDEVSEQGLPQFYLQDIPPTSDYMQLDEMRIYFGEKTNDYVITGTSTNEFDYPSGDENIYTTYSGNAGVPLDGILKKVIYAFKFSSPEILVSGSLTEDSKLLMNRNIGERVSAIAPFLVYDYDPYIVVSEGKLYWIMDAYTITNTYPYSEPVYLNWNEVNYIRNSVKVVIDAYEGDVSYYIVDDVDPIIKTYDKMFPGLFKGFGEMPGDLKDHLRYPELMFRTQAEIYSTYHMKDPMVFYNREDVWVVPDEVYRGSRQEMQPYYIIMKLPGEEKEEFILMIPFTPKGKENMIGWMAARSDKPNYGKVLVYQFSKQELTYGPMQIEARIDQDTDISQLITLWSQSGSSVVRGNTLVIPIENSILYVEPLYLEATERGTLPQLQRVIVSYGDKLTMQDTLSDALDVIFGGSTAGKTEKDETVQLSGTDTEKLARIAELYDKAQHSLNAGDLGTYQDYIDQIGVLVS